MGGEFYTPRMVSRLIIECLDLREGMTVYDPTCGAGGMLLESIHFMERRGKGPQFLRLYGQEINGNTWAICRVNLMLHGADADGICRGDTLRDPKHLMEGNGNALRVFDRVLANPPFSLSPWGHELWCGGDPYGRDRYGCPPRGYGDFAFVQHMISSVGPQGKLGVVLPHGILYRGGSEARIRKGMLQDGLIEAVIGLAGNLFYGTDLPTCIVIVSLDRPAERRNGVVVINAASLYRGGRPRNDLEEKHVEIIANAFHAWEDKEGFCRVVPLSEIAANNYSLNISQYVTAAAPADEIDVSAAMQVLRAMRSRRDETERRMEEALNGLGYGG
jgi:type I restriction enzyme M protein